MLLFPDNAGHLADGISIGRLPMFLWGTGRC
jgi:hypothetical protein